MFQLNAEHYFVVATEGDADDDGAEEEEDVVDAAKSLVSCKL